MAFEEVITAKLKRKIKVLVIKILNNLGNQVVSYTGMIIKITKNQLNYLQSLI